MPLGLLCTKGSRDEVSAKLTARVELLDDSSFDLILTDGSTGSDCLEIIAEKLGLTETAYFGLQYRKKGDDWWLDLAKPVAKQLSNHGRIAAVVTLKFRVKYFVCNAYSLQEEIARYLYYLQLKKNVLAGLLLCDEQAAVVLASYIAQAEFGDADEENHHNYAKDFVLLPCTLVPVHTQNELSQQIKELHTNLRGLSAHDAEMEFIRLVQQLEGYGDEYYPAKDNNGYVLLIGATFLGIVIRHPHGLPPVYFKWPDIVRITHSKKYFCIETIKSLNTIQFEMESREMAKYVWKMFVGHHRFRRMNVTRTPLESERTRPPKAMKIARQLTLKRVDKADGVNEIQVNGKVDKAQSTGGIVNPVFDDAGDADNELNSSEEDITQATATSFQTEPIIHRTYSNDNGIIPRPLSSCIPERDVSESIERVSDRPVSVDFSSIQEGRPIMPVQAAHKGAGSSVSVDSGHPPGSMEFTNGGASLNNLDEIEDGNPMVEQSLDVNATTIYETTPVYQPTRPQSLNLELMEINADNSSVVTGHTSGYSTSADSDEEPSAHEQSSPEIPLSREQQLAELEKMLAEGQVYTEYQKTSRKSETLGLSTGQLPTNADKNRYQDVLPYEETRVHLNPRHNGSNSDYINANIIRIKVGRDIYRYIAAQGPMTNTLNDFWQMIWEQNVHVVVMATEEKSASSCNCHRYWPEEVGQAEDFGHVRVFTEDIRDSSPYKTRRFRLQHMPTKQQRTVYHVQFTDWPDHRVPDDPTSFLEFLDQVESLRQRTSTTRSSVHESKPPVLVHCTAGVGRTGVIILTDLMIACIQNNKRINIHHALVRLRRQRMLLVANFGQYRFVYSTVIHYIKNSRLI